MRISDLATKPSGQAEMSTKSADSVSKAATMAVLWGLPEPGAASTSATNNMVWRCGDVWLKAFMGAHHNRIDEIEFISRLKLPNGLTVPGILPLHDGSRFAVRDGILWTAETHLAGYHPNPNDPQHYAATARGIASFHKAIQTAPVTSPNRFVSYVRQSLSAFPDLEGEAASIAGRAFSILQSVVDEFDTWPRQPIHGDLSHPNIVLMEDGGIGFIDFEFASIDPLEFDVAVAVTTLLIRSNLEKTHQENIMLQILEETGCSADRVLLAVLARRWLAFTGNLNHEAGMSSDTFFKHLRHFAVIMPWVENALSARGVSSF